MNIVYIIPHLRQPSGMERVLCIKANYLADVLNFNVTIITYRQGNSPIFFPFSKKIKIIDFNLKDPTFSLHTLPYFKRRVVYKNFIHTFHQKLDSFLHEHPSDIVISLFLGVEHLFLHKIKDGSNKILEFHFNFEKGPLKLLKENWKISNFKEKFQVEQLKKTINKYEKLIVLTQADAYTWEQHGFKNVDYINNPITIPPPLNKKFP